MNYQDTPALDKDERKKKINRKWASSSSTYTNNIVDRTRNRIESSTAYRLPPFPPLFLLLHTQKSSVNYPLSSPLLPSPPSHPSPPSFLSPRFISFLKKAKPGHRGWAPRRFFVKYGHSGLSSPGAPWGSSGFPLSGAGWGGLFSNCERRAFFELRNAKGGRKGRKEGRGEIFIEWDHKAVLVWGLFEVAKFVGDLEN